MDSKDLLAGKAWAIARQLIKVLIHDHAIGIHIMPFMMFMLPVVRVRICSGGLGSSMSRHQQGKNEQESSRDDPEPDSRLVKVWPPY
jgi:hypothetical protein